MYNNASFFITHVLEHDNTQFPSVSLLYKDIPLTPKILHYNEASNQGVLRSIDGKVDVLIDFDDQAMLDECVVSPGMCPVLWRKLFLTAIAHDQAEDAAEYAEAGVKALAFEWLNERYAIQILLNSTDDLSDEQVFGYIVRVAEEYPEIMAGIRACYQKALAEQIAERLVNSMYRALYTPQCFMPGFMRA